MSSILNVDQKLFENEEFYRDAYGLAVSLGMNILPDPNNDRTKLAVVGFACTPTPFPKKQYDYAREVTPQFQKLYDEISCDSQLLKEMTAPVAAYDEITKRMLEISEKVYTAERPLSGEIRMNLSRNDFMLDMHTKKLVQIELNLFSSSFGGLAENVIHVQRYLMQKYGIGDVSRLPLSANMTGYSALFNTAHQAYLERHPTTAPTAMLMVVLPGENNEFDQRKLERVLFDNYSIVTLRRSFGQLKDSLELKDGIITVDGRVISIIYFRSGYWPEHYEGHWDLRLKMEQGYAVKCPSAPSQLSGMKIVQQLLCNKPSAQHLAPCFGKMGSPDQYKEDAIKNPDNWVLKSQIEGSGAVLFDDEMIERLNQPEGLSEFVLMEKVFPLPTPSIVSHQGKPVLRDSIGELGIYGGYVASGSEIKMNTVMGHLLRSKGKDTKQGGVFMGHAVVDAPYLVEESEYK